MSRRAFIAPAVLVASATAASGFELAGGHSPVRAIVVLGFVLVAPGYALLRGWGLAHGWHGAALTVALSVALATIVPGALLYAGAWSPRAALLILAGVTITASIASVLSDARRRAPYPTSRAAEDPP